MSVKMILDGGPLDGEEQLVLNLPQPATTGSVLTINLPNYQFFDADGETVVSYGLQVEYEVMSQGPPPNPAQGDTWDTSWVCEFVEESFLPPPPPLYPPGGGPPIQPTIPLVFQEGDTTMTINADDPSPGVQMVDTVTSMEIDADVTPMVGDAYVFMDAVTVLTAEQDTTSYFMSGETSMQITPS